MTFGHDVHSLGDLGVFCNCDGFLCHMIFDVHTSLLKKSDYLPNYPPR